MQRSISLVKTIGAVIAGAVALAVVAGPAQATTSTASISGVVTSAETGQPVAGVRVSEKPGSVPQHDADNPSTVTDASGAYTFADLPAGSYGMAFDPPQGSGLAAEYWRSTYDAGIAAKTMVTLVSGGAVTGVSAALKPAASSISGHVSVPAGFDPTRVAVQAFEADQPAYTAGYTTVRSDGTYSMTGLPADRYKLVFSDVDQRLTRIYWGGASSFDAAAVLTLGVRDPRTGADVTLDTGDTISGKLSGGAVARGWGRAYVYRLTSTGAFEQGAFDRNVQVRSDGTFSITGLADGTYKLAYQDSTECGPVSSSPTAESWTARRFWWKDQSAPQKATTITLKGHQHLSGLTDDLDVTGGKSSRPAVTGTAAVGQTLTASPGVWAAGTPLTYVWTANGTAIPGATAATYKVTSAQAGRTIGIWVLGKTGAPITSVCQEKWDRQTATMSAKVATTATPSVSGTPAVGDTLTAKPGTWTTETSFSYAWYANGTYISGTSGTTHSTFKPTTAQKGTQISVKVTGTKSGCTTAAATSVRTAKVALTAVPKITGTTRVGSTLTAHPGTWTTGTKFSYAWYASGVLISAARSSTFKLASAQRGKTITASVTGVLSGYPTLTRNSAGTAHIG